MSEGAALPGARSETGPPGPTRALSWVLRLGLLTSAILFATGLADYLARHPGGQLSEALSTNPIADYLTLGGLASGLAAGHSQALLALGVLVLVGTTVFRVLMVGVYFEGRGERASAGLSAVVTTLLLIGLLAVGPLLR
jgi:uncharacterized membrane protein